MYRIVLLRHGESVGNQQRRVQGQSDLPLTEKGKQQAQALAEYWGRQGWHFDGIISSPLVRARQTAEIVAGNLAAPTALDPIWKERYFGELENQPYDEIRRNHPEIDFFHPTAPLGGDGETLTDLFRRARRAIDALLEKEPGDYLIVSHGAFLNMALYYILGLTPGHSLHGPRFRLGNTGFSPTWYDPEKQHWWVLGTNLQPHLSPEDQSL